MELVVFSREASVLALLLVVSVLCLCSTGDVSACGVKTSSTVAVRRFLPRLGGKGVAVSLRAFLECCLTKGRLLRSSRTLLRSSCRGEASKERWRFRPAGSRALSVDRVCKGDGRRSGDGDFRRRLDPSVPGELNLTFNDDFLRVSVSLPVKRFGSRISRGPVGVLLSRDEDSRLSSPSDEVLIAVDMESFMLGGVFSASLRNDRVQITTS